MRRKDYFSANPVSLLPCQDNDNCQLRTRTAAGVIAVSVRSHSISTATLCAAARAGRSPALLANSSSAHTPSHTAQPQTGAVGDA